MCRFQMYLTELIQNLKYKFNLNSHSHSYNIYIILPLLFRMYNNMTLEVTEIDQSLVNRNGNIYMTKWHLSLPWIQVSNVYGNLIAHKLINIKYPQRKLV